MAIDPDAPTVGYSADDVALEPGASFGRYKIRTLLGSGGMGAVFLADDPLLDRTVAVKVLRSGASGDRLLREGQVMAKLTHANVIRVYDVGHEGDTAFVAMEHVRGSTLKDWLDQPRRTSEIIDVFVDAGRGLAAAHASGLVHRDFTLSNVMVDVDGRVLVTDFGLARETSSIGEAVRDPERSSLEQTASHAGTVCGTPAYMSPEQHVGGTIDPRSDVFSFCVAMWRAVFHQAPFPGETWAEVAASTRRGVIAPPSETRGVPRRVRAALERGLRVDPAERWPAMEPLLAALAGNRRRVVIAVAAAVVVLAIGGVTFALTRPDPDPCAASPDRFAGIWDPAVRDQLRAAFVATGEPEADKIFDAIDKGIALRLGRWEAMRRDSCRATNIRHDQSDSALDLRATCLDGKLAELDAFVGQLRGITKPMLYKALEPLSAIGDVTPCADASELAHRLPLPSDPARRGSIVEVEGRARQMNAVVSLGTPLDDAKVATLVADARKLDYAPLTAFALAVEARQEITAVHSEKAEQALEQAVLHAEAGGDDSLRFELELALGRLVGLDFERFDDGRHHLDRASALLKRTGGGPSREAQVLDVVALVELRRGRLSVAEQESRSALAKPSLPELDRAMYLHTLGYILIDADRAREAKDAFDEGLAIDERLLGSRHPRVGSMHEGLGGAYRHQHKYDDARRELMLGLDIFQATFGPDALNVGVALANIATLDDSTKHYDVAETEMQKAFEIYKKIYGANSSRTWRLLWRVGSVQQHAKHFDTAATTLQAALAGLRGVFGDNHRQVADVYFDLGKLETNRARPAAAIPYFDAGAASLRASEGPTSKLLRRMYSGRGDAHSDLKEWPLACADYEAAIAVAGEDATGGSNRADLELSYAEALFNANRRAKALEMAKSARQRFEALAATDDVKEADNWIKSKFPSER